jgi:RNA-directed DNA polymerase
MAMVDFHEKRFVRSHKTAIVQKRSDTSFPCEELTTICVTITTEEFTETRGRQPATESKKSPSILKRIIILIGSAIKSLIAISTDAILRKLFTFYKQTDHTIRLNIGCNMFDRRLNIRTLKHLSYRLGIPESVLQSISASAQDSYDRFEKKKKNGKIRVFNSPFPRLKSLQKKLSILLSELALPDNIHSYRKGRSIKTNAIPHIGNDYLLKLDIKDFYPHISNKMVYNLFQSLGCAPNVCRILTKLTTKEGHLPQGAPTSPFIANHIIAKVARRINGLENGHNLVATYYGDDISISGSYRVNNFKSLVRRIVSQEGLKISEEKFAVLGPNEEKVIAGVSVGKNGMSAPKKYYNELVDQILNFTMTEDKCSSIDGKIAYVTQLNTQQGCDLRIMHNRVLHTKNINCNQNV